MNDVTLADLFHFAGLVAFVVYVLVQLGANLVIF